MKKFFYILLISFISLGSYSQTTEDVILSDNEFKILAEKATKFYTSDAYLNYDRINNIFREKVGEDFYMDAEDGSFEPINYKKWIEVNIKKTNFSSIEEAILIHKEFYDAFLKKHDGQKKLFPLLSKLDDRYGEKNFRSVYIKHVLQNFIK